jgi:hypothetical protein
MRRVEFLLEDIRRRTDNETWSDTQGVSDEEILGYLNDAQDHLQEAISNAGLQVFYTSTTIPIVANQEFYSFPELTFTGGRVRTIEYSSSGRGEDWGFLSRRNAQNRDSYACDGPWGYIPLADGFYLVNPVRHDRGFLRICYEEQLFDMDKRRGEVSSAVIIEDPITLISELQSVSLIDNTTIHPDSLESNDYFCVCDKDGTVKVFAAPITSYAAGTRTILTSKTVTEPVLLGDFVTVGKYTSTHSGLPRVCERYLLAYSQVAAQDRDSMQIPVTQNQRLVDIEKSILDTFADRDQDVKPYPMIDTYWFD